MATILIVDDRPVNRQFLVTLLGYGGHHLLEAADGVEALGRARIEHLDLIITDVLMPNMDGVEFAKQLHREPAIASIPIIFFTATHRWEEASALAKSCGVAAVLAKPSEPQIIFDTVHAILGTPQPAMAEIAPVLHADKGRPTPGLATDKLSADLSELETLNLGILETVERGMRLAAGNGVPGKNVKEITRSFSAVRAVSLRLSALIELGLELASHYDPLYLLQTCCRTAQDILSAKYAAIGVLDGQAERLKHLFVRGIGDEAKALLGSLQPRVGVLGRALAEGRPQRRSNLGGDPQAVGLPAAHPPIHSFLVVPIILPNGPYGWLYLADKLGADAFDDDDERLALTLAAQLARAQENLLLYAAARQHGADLEHEVVERRRAEEKLSSILESIDNVVYSVTESELLYLSPVAERVYGRPASAFQERFDLWLEVIHPEDRRRVLDTMVKLREQNAITQEYRIVRPDGEARWLEDRTRVVRDPAGAFLRFDGVAMDISDRKKAEARIEHLATHDALTDLPNRNLLEDRVAQAIAHSSRTLRMAALLFLDLDRFKHVNDSFGHALGDTLLATVAGRLRDTLREGDTVARHGGDEFIILLTDLSAPDDVLHIAAKILNHLSMPLRAGNHEFQLTASIGVSFYPNDGTDLGSLLRSADTAMYRAKEGGGNSVRFYSRDMSAETVDRLRMEGALRRALERQEFALLYQPKVDLLTGAIVGAESLIRWCHPHLGMIPPGRFIPVAEQTGLIVPIGEWVLDTACAQMRSWEDSGLPRLAVSVNLSGRQFHNEGLVKSVSGALRQARIEPRQLELEITESVAMQDVDQIVAKLNALKDLGLLLSVDDFGTGYSSLGHLKRFPLDKIKIDQSFVRDIATDVDDAAIVRAVITLGHNLDLKVIAEGVETKEQLAFLRTHRCDEMQGYYFSRPVPADDFGAMLRADRRLGQA